MSDESDGVPQDGQREDPGVQQPDESLEGDDLERDPLDTGIVPPDRWSAAESFGTTPREAREGESLDQLLSEEEPESEARRAPVSDEWQEGPAPRTGRLTSEDEGVGQVEDSELLAFDEGVDGGAAGAEEAAVHRIEDEDGT